MINLYNHLQEISKELEASQQINPSSDYGYYSEQLDIIIDQMGKQIFPYPQVQSSKDLNSMINSN